MSDLQLVARLATEFGAHVDSWPADDLGAHALDLAVQGWEVFPISRRKIPMTAHGHLEATNDPATVAEWWSRWPNANIGLRPPHSVAVIDIDPRHGGDEAWAQLQAEHEIPATMQVWSGRGDGGTHLDFVHPGGRLHGVLRDAQGVPTGIDIKTHSGFVVAPPSIHVATQKAYRWADPLLPIAAMPAGLVRVVRKPAPKVQAPRPRQTSSAESPADWFTETRTWADVLQPHGWHCIGGNGDEDGARWLHAAATSDTSATIRHGLLFVYSTSTVFEPTGGEDPRGYTRFRAWAMLNHGGDLSAAAREAVRLREAP